MLIGTNDLRVAGPFSISAYEIGIHVSVRLSVCRLSCCIIYNLEKVFHYENKPIQIFWEFHH